MQGIFEGLVQGFEVIGLETCNDTAVFSIKGELGICGANPLVEAMKGKLARQLLEQLNDGDVPPQFAHIKDMIREMLEADVEKGFDVGSMAAGSIGFGVLIDEDGNIIGGAPLDDAGEIPDLITEALKRAGWVEEDDEDAVDVKQSPALISDAERQAAEFFAELEHGGADLERKASEEEE